MDEDNSLAEFLRSARWAMGDFLSSADVLCFPLLVSFSLGAPQNCSFHCIFRLNRLIKYRIRVKNTPKSNKSTLHNVSFKSILWSTITTSRKPPC